MAREQEVADSLAGFQDLLKYWDLPEGREDAALKPEPSELCVTVLVCSCAVHAVQCSAVQCSAVVCRD